MQTVGEIIRNKPVNNDIRYKSNNVINDNNGSYKKKYALDRSKFTPNTEESILAVEIATKLNDLDNFACYFGLVKRHGCAKMQSLLAQTLGEIEEKRDTKYPVKYPARYFMWKIKYGH